jgi:transcriptional regulator with GAF, ATPase, and Fis domain
MYTLKDKIINLEREAILEALKECNWVKAQAAKKLGITERMIGYKIKKYGIGIKGVNHGEAKVSNADVQDQYSNQNS